MGAKPLRKVQYTIQDLKSFEVFVRCMYSFCKDHTPIIFLYGELGAGKTTFSRLWLQNCGYKGKVPSPTFTLVQTYTLPTTTLHHFDCYRISKPEQLTTFDIEYYLEDKATILAEWPENGITSFCKPDISIHIHTISNQVDARMIEVEIYNDKIILPESLF